MMLKSTRTKPRHESCKNFGQKSQTSAWKKQAMRAGPSVKRMPLSRADDQKTDGNFPDTLLWSAGRSFQVIEIMSPGPMKPTAQLPDRWVATIKALRFFRDALFARTTGTRPVRVQMNTEPSDESVATAPVDAPP
jgi:hypothetical protein